MRLYAVCMMCILVCCVYGMDELDGQSHDDENTLYHEVLHHTSSQLADVYTAQSNRNTRSHRGDAPHFSPISVQPRRSIIPITFLGHVTSQSLVVVNQPHVVSREQGRGRRNNIWNPYVARRNNASYSSERERRGRNVNTIQQLARNPFLHNPRLMPHEQQRDATYNQTEYRRNFPRRRSSQQIFYDSSCNNQTDHNQLRYGVDCPNTLM